MDDVTTHMAPPRHGSRLGLLEATPRARTRRSRLCAQGSPLLRCPGGGCVALFFPYLDFFASLSRYHPEFLTHSRPRRTNIPDCFSSRLAAEHTPSPYILRSPLSDYLQPVVAPGNYLSHPVVVRTYRSSAKTRHGTCSDLLASRHSPTSAPRLTTRTFHNLPATLPISSDKSRPLFHRQPRTVPRIYNPHIVSTAP